MADSPFPGLRRCLFVILFISFTSFLELFYFSFFLTLAFDFFRSLMCLFFLFHSTYSTKTFGSPLPLQVSFCYYILYSSSKCIYDVSFPSLYYLPSTACLPSESMYLLSPSVVLPVGLSVLTNQPASLFYPHLPSRLADASPTFLISSFSFYSLHPSYILLVILSKGPL